MHGRNEVEEEMPEAPAGEEALDAEELFGAAFFEEDGRPRSLLLKAGSHEASGDGLPRGASKDHLRELAVR